MAIKYDYYKAKINTNKTVGLLCGAGESPHSLQVAAKELVKSCNVIMFLNPGFKNYTHEKLFYNATDLAKIFLEAVKDLDLSDFYLLGHCMGGLVAQEMAILEPKMIKKIILVSSHYGSYHRLNRHEYLKHELKFCRLEQYLFTPEFSENNPQIIQELNENLKVHRLSKENLIGQCYCGYGSSTMQRLFKITQSALIIHGKQDFTVLPKFAKELASGLAKSKLVMLDNVGHSPLVEAPYIINDILDFISSDEEFPVKDILNIFSKEEIEKDNQFLKDAKTYDFTLRVCNLFGNWQDRKDLSKAMEDLKINE